MQFVEYDAPERAKHVGRISARDEQRKLLRRGEQDVGRITPLTLTLRCRSVAGPRFEPDIQVYLLYRDFQIACDVNRKCLQRRDVQSVEALRANEAAPGRLQFARSYIPLAQFDERWQKTRERLAASGRRNQQRGSPCPRLRQQIKLMRARPPATACEPAREAIRQQLRCVEEMARGFHNFRVLPTRSVREQAHLFPCESRRNRD